LGIATISLAIYRKVLAQHEDTSIHLAHGGATMVEGQAAMAAKLAAIDKYGKLLTIATFVLGLGIGCVYVYEALLAVPV
jgi:hypothetical protein